MVIKDMGGDKIFKQLFALDKKKVEVGFNEESGQDNVNKAGWAQFGTKTKTGGVHSPARPFMSIAFERNLSKLNRWIDKNIKLVAVGQLNATPFLNRIGRKHKVQITQTIKSNVPPANAAATIRLKGHGQTLRDTKEMLGSVRWKIK